MYMYIVGLPQGIPPDAIFGTDDAMDDYNPPDSNYGTSTGSHGNRHALSEEPDDDDIVQSRKRRRLLEDSDGETGSVG